MVKRNKAKKSGSIRKYITYAGNLLMIVSLVFICRSFYKSNINYNELVSSVNLLSVFFVAVIYSFVFVASSQMYRFIASFVVKKRLGFLSTSYSYVKSNLYKYLPGNVFQYVARNGLATNEQVSHVKIAFVSVIEVFYVVLASVICMLAFSMNYTVEWVKTHGFPVWILILFAILALLVIAAVIVFRKRIVSWLNENRSEFNPMFFVKSFICVLFYILVSVLNALLFCWVVALMGYNIPIKSIPTCIGLFSLAWVMGFLTPGAPGGVGIRETISLTFFSRIVPYDVLLISLIVFRVVSIIGELLAFLYFFILKKLFGKSEVVSQG